MPSAYALHALAAAAGIQVCWTDADGRDRMLDDAVIANLLEHLPVAGVERADGDVQGDWPPLLTADPGQPITLPSRLRVRRNIALRDEQGIGYSIPVNENGTFAAPMNTGYYVLEVGREVFTLAVAPLQCFAIGDALREDAPRAWGLAVQVYGLRRRGDGGVGSSRAVGELAAHSARAGADALGLSPLHAMSPVTRGYSPYSPSHRGFLNGLHTDPADALGSDALAAALNRTGLGEAWQQAGAQALIDWPSVAALHNRVWQAMHEDMQHADRPLQQELKQFEQRGGGGLRAHALIAARQACAALNGESTSWRDWESGWCERGHGMSGFFAASHAQALDFQVFTQWAAARAWATTRQQAAADGMRLGLIVDIAVGFESGGSEAWRHRDLLLKGLSLGAPPDAFNEAGQQWGVTSYAPRLLRQDGYRPFLELLRANMAMGGGIRIDHILGLGRLWVVPDGAGASEGGYIDYPLIDLLRLLALESWRHRCVVIGEDLGTVPAALRAILAARGVMGTDVLLFNRDEKGAFVPPSRWRTLAIATTTTHDLPPLAGWRGGTDIDATAAIRQWPEQQTQAAHVRRRRDVEQLESVFEAADVADVRHSPEGFNKAAIRYVAASAASLMLLPMEDALGLREQPNLPGTVQEHANWRQRLPPLEDMCQLQQSMSLANALRKGPVTDA
jgi:4-alpha-glucanotransferase